MSCLSAHLKEVAFKFLAKADTLEQENQVWLQTRLVSSLHLQKKLQKLNT